MLTASRHPEQKTTTKKKAERWQYKEMSSKNNDIITSQTEVQKEEPSSEKVSTFTRFALMISMSKHTDAILEKQDIYDK